MSAAVRQGAAAPLAILTVVRNDLAGLRRTAASLAAQRWQGFVWVVIDGASDDGTAEWLAAGTEPPARWRSAPDRGLYHAMNRALDAAPADAVLFLNAGDTLADAETAGRLAAALASAPGCGFLYGDVWQQGTECALWLKPARSHRFAGWGMFASHQGMLYRRSAIAFLRFDERFQVGADYAFTIKALENAGAVARLPFPVSVCARPGLSARRARDGRRDQARIRRQLLGHGALRTVLCAALQIVWQGIASRFPWTYAHLRGVNSETSFLSEQCGRPDATKP